jgi:hypothetical protein
MAERADRSVWRAMVKQPAAYMVPMVVEQTSRGERGYDIFSLLLKKPHRVPEHAHQRCGR